jgi:hypothetical protein
MEEPDLLQLTQEALDLAATACHFDKEENYVGAYDYYDKCILNLDEVMGKLPPTSTQWRKLMEIRTQYDDRMDQLKEIENSRGSLASFSLGFNKNTTRDSESGKSSFMGTKKKKVQEEFIFHEIDIAQDFTFEEPPKNVAEVPFWQLRNVKKSIEQGAFFTKSLFISKNIWCQSDVKFSGVNAKTAAFEIILNLVANDIESLYFSSDDDSITLAEHTFLIVEEELLSLRNQLSKSFPYIKEVVPEADKDDSSHLPGQKDNNSQHNSPAPPPAAGGGNTMRSASPAPASATSTVPSDGSSHSSSTSAPLPASSASSKVHHPPTDRFPSSPHSFLLEQVADAHGQRLRQVHEEVRGHRPAPPGRGPAVAAVLGGPAGLHRQDLQALRQDPAAGHVDQVHRQPAPGSAGLEQQPDPPAPRRAGPGEAAD